MITEEMLNSQDALKGLTPEQKQLVVTLSKNDENAVIGAKFGEVYRQMDETIEKATGIKRDGAEKTYNYLERAAKAFADDHKAKVTALEAEKAELEEKVKKGNTGDAELKAQLDTVKAELQTTKDQFNTLKTEKDQLAIKHAEEILGIRIDGEMAKAREGLKFKAGLSDVVIKTLVDNAIAKVKSNSPKFEGEEGKQVLHFFDDKGVIMNNPDNKLNPYTAQELLVKELTAMDILDKAPRKGAGGKTIVPGGSSTLGASTQIEAVETITKELLDRGMVKGSPEFDAELSKMWDENQISSLPLQ